MEQMMFQNIGDIERITAIMSKSSALFEAIVLRDRITALHSEKVAFYSLELAKEVGYNQHYSYVGGLLHDAGKLKIEDKILKSPKKLTLEEMNTMKKHAYFSYKLLYKLNFPDEITEGILYHHERWDGSGYPEGLKKEQIPLLSQIIGVTDSFEALTSDRPYQVKKNIGEAIAILEKESHLYNPDLLEMFLKRVKKNLCVVDSFEVSANF